MFDELELNPERIPLYKLILHIAQIVLSFVCWCLEIAVFRSTDASINGQNGWAFAVCFISFPAWVYLIGAPRYPRTRRFAEPHAMVVVDALFCVIWLSAFAAQAAYNTAGKCGDGCGMSKAIVALGVFITLLFGFTTFFSIWTLKYYQFNGRLPGYDRLNGKKDVQNIDPDMAAFSTAPMGDEPYARLNDMDADHDDPSHQDAYRTDLGGGYGGASSHLDTNTSYGGSAYGGSGYGSQVGESALSGSTGLSGRSGAVSSSNPFDEGQSALSTSTLRPAASASSLSTSAAPSTYMPPTVHDAYDDDLRHQPVRFPEADYSRN